MNKVRSAKLLVFDTNDNVLVLRRSSTHPWAAYQPDLPGGVIEDDETFEEGIVRELQEETMLIVATSDLRQLYNVEQYETHDIAIERHLFGVRLKTLQPPVTLSWEHDQFDWISIHDVKGLEPPNQIAVDRIIKDKLWQSL